MATIKERINISLPKQMRIALKTLAKRDAMPEATKASQLLAFALEVEEDIFFGVLANARMKKGGKSIPDSDAIWK